LLSTRLHLTPSIGVYTNIQRVLQQVLPRHAMGPTPLNSPLGETCAQADPELNGGLHEIAQEGVGRAELVTCAHDSPHHVLDVCVRIMDHLARRVVDIPNGSATLSAPRRAFCKEP
jgi:hypothetical protein